MEEDNDKGLPSGHGVYVGPEATDITIRRGRSTGNRGDGYHILGQRVVLEDAVAERNGSQFFVGEPRPIPKDLLAAMKAEIDANAPPESVAKRLGPRMLEAGFNLAAAIGAGVDLVTIYGWLRPG